MSTEASISVIKDLLLNAPLYKVFQLSDPLPIYEILAGLSKNVTNPKVDGYCPICGKDTTFSLRPYSLDSKIIMKDPALHVGRRVVHLHCARSIYHVLSFWLDLGTNSLSKIGQNPSVADIAISEARSKYSKVQKGDNWKELYKAIGLAAHGEGIGSFVYLRRVLERLIQSRFEQFKKEEGWSDEQFVGLRMDEKVLFLKNHLPAHLVESRRIYGIFSKGIHELDNDQCLQFFEVGKQSIIVILEDDLKKVEELAARAMLKEAVAKFSPGSSEAH